jgi:hypothetical protein
MAVEAQIPSASLEKQTDNEGDAFMSSARSASEIQRFKGIINTTTPLRKSASGATFARLRVMTTSEMTTGESPNPRIPADVDASYCSYDVTNTKNLGNQSPVSQAYYFLFDCKNNIFISLNYFYCLQI